jgi:P27 family predicted phage terminase small subunit
MPRGKKKTAAQHKKEGTYRKDRHETPAVTPGRPPKPENLNPRAAQIWDELADTLTDHNMVATIDALALRLLAETIADYEEARAEVIAFGLTVDTPNGCPVQNPAVGIMNRQREAAVKLLRKFGMTPLDRTGLKPMEGAKQQSDFEKLIFGRGSLN